MFYSFDVVIPANTTEAAPFQLEVEMAPGTVHRVEVQVPRGVRGLARTRAFHALHQVWPANPEGSLTGDDVLIAWSEEWELDEEPFALILEGWNDDDTFPHTLTWRFALAEAAGPAAPALLLPAAPPALAELVIP